MSVRSKLMGAANRLLGPLDLQLGGKGGNDGSERGYVPAEATIAAARRHGLSVGDYLEAQWGETGKADRVLAQMRALRVFGGPLDVVCEIGTGSGRYLERVLELGRPARYESYETADDWASWLARQYPIVSQPADGSTLGGTPDASVSLVHAHGLFVYLPFVTSFAYFREIARVTATGGFAVFDIISEDCLGEGAVDGWLQAQARYLSFLSRAYVCDYFSRAGFSLRGDFQAPYGPGESCYLVFLKER